MVVNVYGVDPAIGEVQWSRLLQIIGKGAWQEIVHDALGQMNVTSVTGTRTVRVADGDAVAAGVLISSTGNVDVVLDANNGASPRVDYIVAEINWQTNSGSIKAVKGTVGGGAPGLTRTFGDLWQIPLAKVTLQPLAGQLNNGMIENVRPKPRQIYVYTINIAADQTCAPGNSSGVVIGSQDIPDPGWPFRLHVGGDVPFEVLTESGPAGRGTIQLNVGGTELSDGAAPRGNLGAAVLRSEWSDIKNAALSIGVRMIPASMSGENLRTNAGGKITIAVVPS